MIHYSEINPVETERNGEILHGIKGGIRKLGEVNQLPHCADHHGRHGICRPSLVSDGAGQCVQRDNFSIVRHPFGGAFIQQGLDGAVLSVDSFEHKLGGTKIGPKGFADFQGL